MPKLSKKQSKSRDAIKVGHLYTVAEAVPFLKANASNKFVETLDVCVTLGIDPKKNDQAVRGSTVMPNGTGKTVRVAVFAQGDNVDKAKNAGADVVGFDDLAASMKAGDLNYDVVIATPDAMRVVGQLGQVLGPRGLMPNPKVGTVTVDVAAAVHAAKSGQVRYRVDKNGIIHCSVGKIDFPAEHVAENISALLTDLKKLKPASSKGIYIKKVTLTSTMGVGLPIDLSSVTG